MKYQIDSHAILEADLEAQRARRGSWNRGRILKKPQENVMRLSSMMKS